MCGRDKSTLTFNKSILFGILSCGLFAPGNEFLIFVHSLLLIVGMI